MVWPWLWQGVPGARGPCTLGFMSWRHVQAAPGSAAGHVAAGRPAWYPGGSCWVPCGSRCASGPAAPQGMSRGGCMAGLGGRRPSRRVVQDQGQAGGVREEGAGGLGTARLQCPDQCPTGAGWLGCCGEVGGASGRGELPPHAAGRGNTAGPPDPPGRQGTGLRGKKTRAAAGCAGGGEGTGRGQAQASAGKGGRGCKLSSESQDTVFSRRSCLGLALKE